MDYMNRKVVERIDEHIRLVKKGNNISVVAQYKTKTHNKIQGHQTNIFTSNRMEKKQ